MIVALSKEQCLVIPGLTLKDPSLFPKVPYETLKEKTQPPNQKTRALEQTTQHDDNELMTNVNVENVRLMTNKWVPNPKV